MFERHFRILGRSLVLSSDRPDFMDIFQQEYGCFLRSSRSASRADLSLKVSFDAAPPSLVIVLSGAGARRRTVVSLPDVRPRFVFELVQREIFRALPEFVFLHAAVAVKGGAALAVSGPSGAGKTTLLLSLVEAGFNIFSDEYCPIRIETGRVAPFPRALSPRLVSHDPMARRTIPVTSIGRDPGLKDAPLRQIVFLESEPVPGTPAGCSVVIASGRLRSFLRSVEPAQARTRRISGTGFHSVVLGPPDDRVGRLRLFKALHAHREAVLHVHRRDDRRGVFAGAPDIGGLTASEAARLFMSNLIGNDNPALADKPGAVFFQVCRLLRGVSCLAVRSGPPRETAAALAAIWAAADKKHGEGG